MDCPFVANQGVTRAFCEGLREVEDGTAQFFWFCCRLATELILTDTNRSVQAPVLFFLVEREAQKRHVFIIIIVIFVTSMLPINIFFLPTMPPHFP